MATILRNVNETMDVAREKIVKIEAALSGIKQKFEHATSSVTLLVEGVKKVVEYAIEKKKKAKEEIEEGE